MDLRPLLRVAPDHFALADRDTRFTASLDEKAAEKMQAEQVSRLESLQEKFYAEGSRAMLLALQGMDTSGKDGTIKHVLSGVNPQGVDVHGFRAPSGEELRHDYLWRAHRVMPERGRIGIFNRSYYEEVLVVRVHRELLDAEHADANAKHAHVWRSRFDDMVNFERYLEHNGTRVVKVFLHISKREQRKRLLARLEDPTKCWKFSPSDVTERAHWDRYQRAYEQMLQATSTDVAPWYVVPADHKWFARAAVSSLLAHELTDIRPEFPSMPKTMQAQLVEARRTLESERD
jgi:PPK2 family polyphosphate:nucleotide phosphotransferase